MCGEHLSVDNMNRAIEMLEDEMNVDVREFAVAGVEHGSLFAHKWYLGVDSELDADIARPKIDDYLKTLNDDYRVERIEAIKRDFFFIFCPGKHFSRWMKMQGKEGGGKQNSQEF